MPELVMDDRMPIDAVALVNPITGQRVVMTGLRHDCARPGCQLSLCHPLPHCVRVEESHTGGSTYHYAMVDDDGNVLRRL